MDLAWIWHLSLFTGSRAGSAHGQQRGPHTIGSAWPRGCSCKPCPRARRGGEGAARPHGTPCAVCCACSPTRAPEHGRAFVPVSVQGSARSSCPRSRCQPHPPCAGASWVQVGASHPRGAGLDPGWQPGLLCQPQGSTSAFYLLWVSQAPHVGWGGG